MTRWRVRSGSSEDAEACAGIVAGLPDYFTPDAPDMVREDVRTHEPWVVTDRDTIVGFCLVVRRRPAAAEIRWAATTAERRHQGIGKALVERVLEELRLGGVQLVEVKTLDRGHHRPAASVREERAIVIMIDRGLGGVMT